MAIFCDELVRGRGRLALVVFDALLLLDRAFVRERSARFSFGFVQLDDLERRVPRRWAAASFPALQFGRYLGIVAKSFDAGQQFDEDAEGGSAGGHALARCRPRRVRGRRSPRRPAAAA